MLTANAGWVEVVEVTPPRYPDMSHVLLLDRWDHVLVTDNVFRQIRVSPYAYGARLTHDAPSVHPSLVVSTRDRNILAIESEVRGAIGNGVDSFLVVVGDVLPEVEHWANNYEIVEHLRQLQAVMPAFEVGMNTRFRDWVYRRRIEAGAQFLVAGPVMDPEAVESRFARLRARDGDPPVYLGIIPPFSPRWVVRMEEMGAVEASGRLKGRLENTPEQGRRRLAWRLARETARRARDCGFAGVVLMGLKWETVIGEASEAWHEA